ncbi:unnamed protein product [Citrullus colocynthis]|uniref:Uncharacterized protein n=1 Tax=Citrullus colocynthis TaxID=252529 RepID=A0ABP0Y7L9_9ROSI
MLICPKTRHFFSPPKYILFLAISPHFSIFSFLSFLNYNLFGSSTLRFTNKESKGACVRSGKQKAKHYRGESETETKIFLFSIQSHLQLLQLILAIPIESLCALEKMND